MERRLVSKPPRRLPHRSILEERPEVIVEFANRYNGPKVEERDALRALYTEALQRIDRAA